MTQQTKMPEPVAWRNWSAMSSNPSLGFERHDELSSDALITTTQAEAYAAARVQELLHEEAKPNNIKRAEYYGEGYTDGWKAALEAAYAIAKNSYLAAMAGRVKVNEADDGDRNMEIFNVGQLGQALAYSKMEEAIRALIPSTPA